MFPQYNELFYSYKKHAVLKQKGNTPERVKTPKILLLPSVIKILTNHTQIINILNRLGNGVLYSILSEMHTKSAYFFQTQQSDEAIMPINTAKEALMIYLADNIDQNEETLAG